MLAEGQERSKVAYDRATWLGLTRQEHAKSDPPGTCEV